MDILSLFYPFKNLTSGDTWKWTVTLSNYPSTKYFIKYLVKNKDTITKTFTSAPSEDGFSHSISVPGAETATYMAGQYTIIAQLVTVIDQDKTTLPNKLIEIKPDLTQVSDDYDPRSYNQKCLDALKQVIFEGASNDLLEEIYKDHTLKFKSHAELRKELRRVEILVQEEDLGIKSGRLIKRYL